MDGPRSQVERRGKRKLVLDMLIRELKKKKKNKKDEFRETRSVNRNGSLSLKKRIVRVSEEETGKQVQGEAVREAGGGKWWEGWEWYWGSR